MTSVEGCSIAWEDNRLKVRCGRCRSTFSPGSGRQVPANCPGCRRPYPFDEDARDLIDAVNAGAVTV